MKHRKGYSPIYKWFGLVLLTGFVFTGALPERTKAEPIIYPVIPLTEPRVPVRNESHDSFIEEIGRRVRLALCASAEEINEQRRVREASASDRGGNVGTADSYDEGDVLQGTDQQDDGAYSWVAEEYSEPALTYLGAWTATAYCSCIACTSDGNGSTASGTIATAGRTVACNALPMGSRVLINGQEFIVEDTGWTPYGDAWVDIYFDSHDDALAFGVQTVDVYLIG